MRSWLSSLVLKSLPYRLYTNMHAGLPEVTDESVIPRTRDACTHARIITLR